MVTAEELAARAPQVSAASELRALFDRLRRGAQPVIDRMPALPEHKALISVDGGRCPDDGSSLVFDPWSPGEHRCQRCGKSWRGERHDRNWAKYQHLWLAERAAHLGAVAALGEPEEAAVAAARAGEILRAYAERYWRYPNRDNVLGPSRLFFSTYLESVWTLNYLGAAALLRAAGRLDEVTARGVNQVADEAATLIGDYDEGYSNRQTWNNAALVAVAVWFEDEDLARRAIEGDTGLIAHLVRGYGRDGMWYEGENYHFFALRGMLLGSAWARLAGVDFAADSRLSSRLAAALAAPTFTALPDFTFPARKDSRFGSSLAQPAYAELWEIGLARLAAHTAPEELQHLTTWLRALYREAKPPVPELFESYLHDAPLTPAPLPLTRDSLSWWSLLEMLPELGALPAADRWSPISLLLESQGLAVLRRDDRYVSLEAGPTGGGHGHPDHLHLTLHADGVHWLPDPGTGSYVIRDLFWYRSTLAHNAPRLDGESLPPGDATVQCFDVQGDWAWARGEFENLSRTVTAGPAYIVDITELTTREDHLLELSWHVAGRGGVETQGRWVDDDFSDEFVTRARRFVPDAAGGGGGPIVLVHAQDRAALTLHLVFDGELLEAEGPGLPVRGGHGGPHDRTKFYVIRARGRNLRIVAVLEPHAGNPSVQVVQTRGDTVEVHTKAGVQRHRFTATTWTVEQDGQPLVTLAGARERRPPFTPILELEGPTPVAAPAFRVGGVPPLDGSLEGFELAEPMQLTLEDQYRRSEDAYPGPEEFSAAAYAAWDERALYLAVEVTKPDLCFRPESAPPLNLDNEPDDIHSDGLQIYIARAPDAGNGVAPADAVGYLIVPNQGGHSVRARATTDTRSGTPRDVTGSWRRTETGYRVTLAIPWPEGLRPHAGGRVAFDLLINEGLPGRTRRVGQLVWSGGNGWVWLRGDRQHPSRFGILELVV